MCTFSQLNLCARLSLNCAAATISRSVFWDLLAEPCPWPQWYQKAPISTRSLFSQSSIKSTNETSVKTNWVWLKLVKMRSKRPRQEHLLWPIQSDSNQSIQSNPRFAATNPSTTSSSPRWLLQKVTFWHLYLPAGWHHRDSSDDNYSEYK